MREITSHKVSGLNEALKVLALDEPGSGGACHHYQIATPNKPLREQLKASAHCNIEFQDGPIGEAGVNGISNEALLAVLIDRLQGFQSGAFKCRENAIALTKLEEVMHWLQHRTRERMARGVEGALKP